mgnify:CR=1 FL=1
MIITHLDGGLGNQLFQYATARRLAHKLNTELKLDIRKVSADKFSHHAYYRLGEFNIIENFATVEEIEQVDVVQENSDTNILNLRDNVLLHGFWLDEKYFMDIREILLKELTLKNSLHENSARWKEKILSAKNSVSLHVRRGDFTMPMHRKDFKILPIKYYQDCVNYLKQNFSDITLFIFSDDIDTVKSNFNFDVPINFVEGCESDCEEMYLMSICKHNILANSTFSWWGAWLNQNPNKKVYAPTPWIRSGAWPDIIPASWIKIPVDYNKNLQEDFPPIVSIVLYVDDNAKNLAVALESIFKQNFPYPEMYELVIIDASTNNFCRKYAANNNVTIIKSTPQTTKYLAWNIGINVAKGELLLFLTSDNFIFDSTMLIVANVWEYNFRKKFPTRDNYLSYKNFNTVSSEIISSVQKISEDDFGTLNIQALKNKKFSLRTDEQFKNLKEFSEINISNAQKVMMLASRQINNSISTKFFKREFLTDNEIYFDENLGADTELFFLISAFMHGEDIIFIPQVFSGELS